MTPTPGSPYEWDGDKRRETLSQRGLDFALAYQIDWTGATHQRQEREGETRFASLRLIDHRLYHIVWTPRDSFTRMISLRKANDREIARYEREDR